MSNNHSELYFGFWVYGFWVLGCHNKKIQERKYLFKNYSVKKDDFDFWQKIWPIIMSQEDSEIVSKIHIMRYIFYNSTSLTDT